MSFWKPNIGKVERKKRLDKSKSTLTNNERMHERLRKRSPEQYAKLVELLKKS